MWHFAVNVYRRDDMLEVSAIPSVWFGKRSWARQTRMSQAYEFWPNGETQVFESRLEA